MTELIFNKRDGWSHEDAAIFLKLAEWYLILIEESKGVSACTITALVEIDICKGYVSAILLLC